MSDLPGALGNLIAAVVLIVAIASCSEQPRRDTLAVVVDIAPSTVPKLHVDEVMVTVRSPDGMTGSAPVQLDHLACRVGDTVRAGVRGIALTLDPHACVR